MEVFTFKLNESGTSRLIVSVANVKPYMAATPALIHVPGGGFMFCSESDTVALGSRLMGKGVGVICTYLYPVARDYRFPQVVVDLMRSIKILRDQGIKAGLFRPITLWPFPIDALLPLLQKKLHRIVVVEASPGQLEDEMYLALSHAGAVNLPPIEHVRHLGGILPQSQEIAAAVLKMEEVQ